MQEYIADRNIFLGAIDSGSICLFYQPQYSFHSGRLVGLEALLRWRASGQGWRCPVELIAQAEQSEAIHWLGLWVLQEAFDMSSRLASAGISECAIAVNVSPLQLSNPEFYPMTQQCIQASGPGINPVELEITESCVLTDLEVTLPRLNKLRQMGFKLALDDFGTGYSSLNYLSKLPINKLKMDRSFVADLETSKESRIVARSIISLAHELGINVIAEGVETVGQAAMLRDWGCDQVQGFLYGMPQCEQDIFRFLSRQILLTG